MIGSVSPFLQGIIEIDETYIGGKPRYKNNGNKRGRGCDKMKVIVAVERKGKVVAKTLDCFNQKVVKDLIIENINLENAEIHIDEYRIYSKLKNIVKHEIVNHSKKECARGNTRADSIEGFWSLVKRAH